MLSHSYKSLTEPQKYQLSTLMLNQSFPNLDASTQLCSTFGHIMFAHVCHTKSDHQLPSKLHFATLTIERRQFLPGRRRFGWRKGIHSFSSPSPSSAQPGFPQAFQAVSNPNPESQESEGMTMDALPFFTFQARNSI